MGLPDDFNELGNRFDQAKGKLVMNDKGGKGYCDTSMNTQMIPWAGTPKEFVDYVFIQPDYLIFSLDWDEKYYEVVEVVVLFCGALTQVSGVLSF